MKVHMFKEWSYASSIKRLRGNRIYTGGQLILSRGIFICNFGGCTHVIDGQSRREIMERDGVYKTL